MEADVKCQYCGKPTDKPLKVEHQPEFAKIFKKEQVFFIFCDKRCKDAWYFEDRMD